MSLRASLVILAAFSLLPMGHAAAQTPEVLPIATERPCVGSGSDIVPAHSLEVESGMNVAYASKGYAADLPETFTRFGIGHRAELRITSTNLTHSPDGAAGAAFAQAHDMAFSAKVGLTRPNAFPVQTIVVSLSVPTGATGQSSGSYDPALILIWQQALRGFTVIENVEALRTSVDARRRNEWLTSISIGHALPRHLAWFAEYAPTFASGSPALHILDGGITYNPTAVTQLDLRAGYQNDPAGLHNLLSVGYSFRIDRLGRHSYAFLH